MNIHANGYMYAVKCAIDVYLWHTHGADISTSVNIIFFLSWWLIESANFIDQEQALNDAFVFEGAKIHVFNDNISGNRNFLFLESLRPRSG